MNKHADGRRSFVESHANTHRANQKQTQCKKAGLRGEDTAFMHLFSVYSFTLRITKYSCLYIQYMCSCFARRCSHSSYSVPCTFRCLQCTETIVPWLKPSRVIPPRQSKYTTLDNICGKQLNSEDSPSQHFRTHTNTNKKQIHQMCVNVTFIKCCSFSMDNYLWWTTLRMHF